MENLIELSKTPVLERPAESTSSMLANEAMKIYENNKTEVIVGLAAVGLAGATALGGRVLANAFENGTKNLARWSNIGEDRALRNLAKWTDSGENNVIQNLSPSKASPLHGDLLNSSEGVVRISSKREIDFGRYEMDASPFSKSFRPDTMRLKAEFDYLSGIAQGPVPHIKSPFSPTLLEMAEFPRDFHSPNFSEAREFGSLGNAEVYPRLEWEKLAQPGQKTVVPDHFEWSKNDFNEAARGPYTLDLQRPVFLDRPTDVPVAASSRQVIEYLRRSGVEVRDELVPMRRWPVSEDLRYFDPPKLPTTLEPGSDAHMKKVHWEERIKPLLMDHSHVYETGVGNGFLRDKSVAVLDPAEAQIIHVNSVDLVKKDLKFLESKGVPIQEVSPGYELSDDFHPKSIVIHDGPNTIELNGNWHKEVGERLKK